ncbi:MAG: multidrug effflux MFS transporter [Gammaproteobacteria bacterium]
MLTTSKTPAILFPILLALYEIATYLSVDMYLPALVQVAEDLSAAPSHAQLTVTLWFLGGALAYLPLGLVADRFGRRPILLWGGVIFIVTTTICALTHDIYTLMIARFIQGATVCSVLIAGYASVHELYKTKEAIYILAWMASITVLAPAFGPVLGSLVLKFFDWRLIFWLLAVWATIIVALLYWRMPESHPISARVQSNLLAALRTYATIIGNPGFISSCLVVCFMMAGAVLWITASPFLVIEHFNYSEIGFGIVQIAVFGSLIIAAQLVKLLIMRMPPKHIVFIGIITILCASLIMLLFALWLPNNLYALIATLMFYMGGIGLLFGPLQKQAIAASEAPMGAKIAIFFTLVATFSSIGSALASIVYRDSLFSLAFPIILMGLCAVALYFLMARRYFQTDHATDD